MKLNNIGYLLKEGFRSIFQHGFMSFAAICVTVACLIIVGSFSALAYNLDIMVQDLNKTSEIMVYIDSDLSDAEARSIGTKINLLDNVFDAKYVSREEALQNFVSDHDNDSAFSGVQAQDLRHRYVVTLEDNTKMEQTAEQLKNLPGVAKVSAAYELAQGFTTLQSVLHIVSVAVIAVLLVFHIPYESYYQGGALINLFLGPATACMAVTIYSQRRLLAKHWLPVLVGCTVGVVTAMGSILLLCRLFGLDRAMTMSLLPKSVTMPIATVVSQGHGGTMAITVAAVVVTGMLGNLCAPLLVKLFRVKDPIAVGLGIGACSHAMGTAKALELGETEGAMSGLAIGLCGILTTVLALFAGFFVA